MNILEFIRRNSIIVLIAIAGVGTGLVVMDYAGSSSMFSRDYFIRVNGTNYSYPDTAALGENGANYLSQLVGAAHRKMVSRFDLDENDNLDEAETAAQEAWLAENMDYEEFVQKIQTTSMYWSFGSAGRAEYNVAINRAILRAEGETLGIKPSPAQIDEYIKSMPIFRQDDGSFDQELYKRFCGYHGQVTTAQERQFRELVSDLIIWDALTAMYTDNVSAHPATQEKLADIFSQRISGMSAWLPATAVSTPAEPTEEELKTFWETTKQNYMSDEQRVITVYTLTAENGQMDDRVGDEVMEKLSMENGKNLKEILTVAAENPENEPFTYSVETYPLSTRTNMAEGLKLSVPYKGENTTLGDIAFTEVTSATPYETYKAASDDAAKNALMTIGQVRGYYRTNDGKFVILCVDAIQSPVVLEYDQAREKALAALKKQKADNALNDAAKKLYDEMTATLAAEGMDAAFAKATEAGAEVKSFGPSPLGSMTNLPQGLSLERLVTVPSNKLAPLSIMDDEGACISGVTGRTYEDSEEHRARRKMINISLNSQLRRQALVLDWLVSAYKRYEVLLSASAANKD